MTSPARPPVLDPAVLVAISPGRFTTSSTIGPELRRLLDTDAVGTAPSKEGGHP